MTEYCAGFFFSKDNKFVVLINKKRPKWQANKENALGGHLEAGETPVQAMVREFREESGLVTEERDWRHFTTLTDNNHFTVYFFFAHSKRDDQQLDTLEQKTDEEVRWWPVDWAVSNLPALPNMTWLLPMALSFDKGEKCQMFEITER